MAGGNFGGGDGSYANPYLVEDREDVEAMEPNPYPTYCYKQVQDIDFGGAEQPFSPMGGKIGPGFSGIYWGDGYNYKNLVIDNSGFDKTGVWAILEGGYIMDLGIYGNILDSPQEHVAALLAGYNQGCIVVRCYCEGNITSNPDSKPLGGVTGGLVGLNEEGSGLVNCKANVNISGGTYSIGGLVGLNRGAVENCLSIGHISCPYPVSTGGLIGSSQLGGTYYSYYDSETSGQSDTGKGTPKTTAQMKSQSTYEGWDFDDVWAIDSSVNNGYPYLRMEYPLCFQTRKRYVEVIECLSSDPDMTMHYNSKYYKFVSFLEEFAITTHPTAGVSIAYEYGGYTVEYGGKDYAFIASGITDPAGPGGYGDYKSGTSRTVKSLATRENFVHFYYIEIANADMAIHSPSEIKSANPMIILDAGVSYPIGAKYHFKLTSYADSGAVTQIATVNSKDNPELFKYSLDEGITWVAFPAGGIANTNTKLLVAARVNVGPRSEVWILPSKELVT